MNRFQDKINQAQYYIQKLNLDGWLLFDFRRSNDLACHFCEIPAHQLLTRRFFYWIPAQGNPIKLVHAIENPLLHVGGETKIYKTWTELKIALGEILKGSSSIAMEFSPENSIPVISKVDGGTIDSIRKFGVEVVSSADILQYFTAVLTEEQKQSHLEAANFLSQTADKTWEWIKHALDRSQSIFEYDVQQFILLEFKENGFETADDPICAINAHSADPHYTPTPYSSSFIEKGDYILIDLWCKKKGHANIYADITRVGVASKQATPLQNEIFQIVRKAQKSATDFVEMKILASEEVRGYEVDRQCRQVIKDCGYDNYFIHRTGHNIDVKDHGSGANIDDYETHDTRLLIPHTCFSIEPGIYLPDQFGVRLEYDVLIQGNQTILITGGIQDEMVCLY